MHSMDTKVRKRFFLLVFPFPSLSIPSLSTLLSFHFLISCPYIMAPYLQLHLPVLIQTLLTCSTLSSSTPTSDHYAHNLFSSCPLTRILPCVAPPPQVLF